MYIYIDESGDLGLTKKSKRYFLIALSVSEDNRKFDIFMRRVRKKKLSKKDRKKSELKAFEASDAFLRYFYDHIKSLDFQIVAVCLDKRDIPNYLKKEEGLIYIQMIEKGLEILVKQNPNKIIITVDRRHYQKVTKEAFNLTLKNFLLVDKKFKKPIMIHQIDSDTNRNIQFADFIVYAFGRKYNFRDSRYYKLLKGKIINESEIKFNKK